MGNLRMPTANKICVNSKCRLLIINQKEYILKSTHSLDFEAKQIWVLILSSYLTATGFEALISFDPLDVNGTTVFTSMCCRNSTEHRLPFLRGVTQGTVLRISA